jgi:hypothetical protein
MTIVHDVKFDGLFGENGSHEQRRARAAEPPMAGMFGANSVTLKRADRKSLVTPSAELVYPDED